MNVEVITLSRAELTRLIEDTASRVVHAVRNEVSRPTPEIMTKAELADYLRCDVSKINRYMKDEDSPLPVEYFGSTPRFRKVDIDSWLRNERIQEIQGTSA